jgi:hypothetical protein
VHKERRGFDDCAAVRNGAKEFLKVAFCGEGIVRYVERKIAYIFNFAERNGSRFRLLFALFRGLVEGEFHAGNQMRVIGVILADDFAVGRDTDIPRGDNLHIHAGKEKHEDTGKAGAGVFADLILHVQRLEEVEGEDVVEGFPQALEFKHELFWLELLYLGDPSCGLQPEEDKIIPMREKCNGV